MSPKLAAVQKTTAVKAARVARFKVEEKLTAVIRKCPQGYVGYVEEIPGTNSHGATVEETKENLAEAVQLILRTQRELSAKRIAAEKHEVIRETLGKVGICNAESWALTSQNPDSHSLPSPANQE